MQPRTRRQKEVFEYIKQFVERHGYEPSYELIARQLKVRSKGGIARHIAALETQGLLARKRENGSFWIDLQPPEKIADSICEIEWLDVPRDETVEEWENQPLFVPKCLLGYQEPERLRAFRALNDAMADEHICEGDVTLIEKRSHARDGDIVVALTGKRVVLKKYYRAGASVELHPANERFSIIKLPADRVEILGVYRGLIRPLH